MFVRHDLARDPPFSKLDLVSCRNVLIYFDQALQKRSCRRFHYCLNQPGFLLLGRTESISGFGQLFSAVDKANKIFARTAARERAAICARAPRPHPVARPVARPPCARRTSAARVDLGQAPRSLAAGPLRPAGRARQRADEILQFRGQTGAYLSRRPASPQNNLFKMARAGLVLGAARGDRPGEEGRWRRCRRSGVEVDQDGFTQACDLVVHPVHGLPDVKEPLFVVLFEEAAPGEGAGARRASPAPSRRRRRTERHPKLEHELAATRSTSSR